MSTTEFEKETGSHVYIRFGFLVSASLISPNRCNSILLQTLTSCSACVTSMVRLKYIVDFEIRSLDVTCIESHHTPSFYRILTTS